MAVDHLAAGVTYRSRAPLRISFGGGGSDLPNYFQQHGGLILNASVNRYVYASIARPSGKKVTFRADDRGLSETLPAAKRYPVDANSKLPLHRAVYNRIVRDYNDSRPLPLTLYTSCDAPVGSGLGTSSALTVAIANCFASALRIDMTEAELARLSHEIERNDIGLAGGLQDQYAAAYGGFNYIEIETDGTVSVNQLRIPRRILAELEYSIILYFSGISRASASIIEKQQRSIACDAAAAARIGRIKQLATDMKRHLLAGNLADFAQVVHASWLLKRRTDASVSNRRIDRIYAAARKNGALGGKILGAGGGGFLLLLVNPETRHRVLNELPRADVRATFCNFVKDGASAWIDKG